jgi:hypothetical protein
MPPGIVVIPQGSEAFEVVKLKTSAMTALRTLSYELSRRTGKRVTFSETLVILAGEIKDADLDNLAQRYNEMQRHSV